jgi:hypothetical protein
MQCDSCGATNRPGAAFCGSCGEATSHVRHDSAGSGTSIRVVDAASPVDPAPSWLHVTAAAQQQEPVVKPGTQASDATRYLCAAVHLDSQLAEEVISEILEQEYKAPPSSPDVDLVPVVLHALAARARHLVRDVILTLLILFALYCFFTLRPFELWVTLVLTWVVVVGETLVATYGVVAHDLRAGVFRPDAVSVPNRAKVRQRLEQIAAFGRADVTVYSSYSPFVGSGIPIEAWSIALDIHRSSEGRVAEPFTALDIHDFVLAGLRDGHPAKVEITDRIFVDGRDIRGDRRFLATELSAPRAQVDPGLVRSLTLEPEDRARTYLTFEVSGWRGQLVLSTFLRFVVTPHELFVEVSHSLLTPVRDEFQEVDRLLPQPTARQAARIGWRSLLRLPRSLFRAPGAVVRFLFGPVSDGRRMARQRREIRSGLRFNYGAPISPRETVSDPLYQRYFQNLDKDLYVKVLEKRLLKALVEFFEFKGIDTAELVERQSTIQNHGVYIAGGGSLIAGSVAAGAGARATSGSAKEAGTARQRLTSATAKRG